MTKRRNLGEATSIYAGRKGLDSLESVSNSSSVSDLTECFPEADHTVHPPTRGGFLVTYGSESDGQPRTKLDPVIPVSQAKKCTNTSEFDDGGISQLTSVRSSLHSITPPKKIFRHAFQDPSDLLRAQREACTVKRVSMSSASLETQRQKYHERIRNQAKENIHRQHPINDALYLGSEDETESAREASREKRHKAKGMVIAHLKNRSEGITSSVAVNEDNFKEHLDGQTKWGIINFQDLCDLHCVNTRKVSSARHQSCDRCEHSLSAARGSLSSRSDRTARASGNGKPLSVGSDDATEHPEFHDNLECGQFSSTRTLPSKQVEEQPSTIRKSSPKAITGISETSLPTKSITSSRHQLPLSDGPLPTFRSLKHKRAKSFQHKRLFTMRKQKGNGYNVEDHDMQMDVLLLLLCLGSLSSLIEYCLILLVEGLQAMITGARSTVQNYGTDMCIFVSLAICLAAVSAFITHRFDPVVSPGGGIAVMKYIIGNKSVKPINYWLQARSLVVKFFGLSFAIACPGLSVGREGPFVHMAAIIANQLMQRVKRFQKIHDSASLRAQVYSSACGVGVASAFTAPIGGVLFSIEVTRTYYLLSNYWKAFAAAISGFMLVRIISSWSVGTAQATQPFFQLVEEDGSGAYGYGDFFEMVQLPFIILLACIMGLLGPLYVTTLIRTKRWLSGFIKQHKHLRPETVIVLVVAIQAILFYACGPFFRIPMHQSITNLLKLEDLPEENWGRTTSEYLGNLWLYFMIRMTFTLVSVSLPLPVGDFMPLFAAGAAFGRFFGMMVAAIFPALRVMPSVYALCGAAAIIGSTTQTFSSAVIALEFTWLFQFQMPILISVFTAVIISRKYSLSIYDATLELRGLNHISPLRHEAAFQLQARDIMVTSPDLNFLATRTKYANIIKLLQISTHVSYPVVNSTQEMIFLGCVARDQLKRHIFRYFEKNDALCDLMEALPGEFDEFWQTENLEEKKLNTPIKLYYPGLDFWNNIKGQEKAPSDNAKEATLSLKQKIWNLAEAKKAIFPSKASSAPMSDKTPRVERARNPMLAKLLDAKFDIQEAPEVTVDPSAFTIPEFMSAEQIYVLFEMLRCKRVFIASFNGTLVGVIDHRIFSNAIKKCSKEN
mmetsp:Transcript_1770/g.2398  ORF Transcript_1770/g.2398 Transcript_1770/m.2398 type:complete len:1120 (-) Transcript_1770:494-3853(-)